MNWFVHLLKSSARARVSYACSVCVYVSGSVCVIVSRECVCEYGAVSVLVNLVCVCVRAQNQNVSACVSMCLDLGFWHASLWSINLGLK